MEVNIQIPDEYLDDFIPKLILQPLVENVIKHAFADKEDKGFIGIVASEKEGKRLEITIFDNGKGINWVPKGMMLIMLIISAVLLTCFLLFGVCGIGVQGVFRLMLGVLLGIAFLICGGCAAWCVCAYRSIGLLLITKHIGHCI